MTRVVTTDLSVEELVLVHQAGFDPLGMVLGSAVFHVGVQSIGRTIVAEMTTITRALVDARRNALDQMTVEARALGAAGVVGVRFSIEPVELGSRLWEVLVMGTAVHSGDGSAPRPFTSHLSGQDFWLLRQSGWTPVALLTGTCVFHLGRRPMGDALLSAGKNVELDHYTESLSFARETALARMQHSMVGVRAQGVVDVKLDQLETPFGRHTYEFLATGTAVRKLEMADEPPTPPMVLPLR